MTSIENLFTVAPDATPCVGTSCEGLRTLINTAHRSPEMDEVVIDQTVELCGNRAGCLGETAAKNYVRIMDYLNTQEAPNA
jgi:hypothetical protein